MSTHTSQTDSATRPYEGSAGREYHDGKRALAPAALEWVMRLRAEKFQPHVRPVDTVLELGVGAGWNLGRLLCARTSAAGLRDVHVATGDGSIALPSQRGERLDPLPTPAAASVR